MLVPMSAVPAIERVASPAMMIFFIKIIVIIDKIDERRCDQYLEDLTLGAKDLIHEYICDKKKKS